MQSKITLMSIIMLLALGGIGALFFQFNPFSSSSDQNIFITVGVSFFVVVIAGVSLIRPALRNNKMRPQTNQNLQPQGGVASKVQSKVSTVPALTVVGKSDPNPSLISQRKPLVSTGIPLNPAKSVATPQTGPIQNISSPIVSAGISSEAASMNRQILQQTQKMSPQSIQKVELEEIPTSHPNIGEPKTFATTCCSFCGRVALPNANFCYSCGSPLNQGWSKQSFRSFNTPVGKASSQNASSPNLYYEEIRKLRESSERFEKLADRFSKLGYTLAVEAGVVLLIVILVFR